MIELFNAVVMTLGGRHTFFFRSQRNETQLGHLRVWLMNHTLPCVSIKRTFPLRTTEAEMKLSLIRTFLTSQIQLTLIHKHEQLLERGDIQED